MSTAPLPLTVVGAGGMLAGEALRLVEQHPHLHVTQVVTRTPGVALGTLHPHLAEAAELATVDLAAATQALRAELEPADARAVLLLALPHAETARTWQTLRSELGDRAERLVALDLSADHRLQDPQAYARWYGPHPDPGQCARFRYGLPELEAEPLAGATRLAAPGCFATALQLAAVPLARAGLLDAGQTWTFSAVTGSSGSGVKPGAGAHHPHRAANLRAYGLDGHRHEAELVAALPATLGAEPPLAFVPHSGPFVRGIHLTAVLPAAGALDLDAARAVLAETYADRPFVQVLSEGAPELRTVVGSNRALLAVAARGGAFVVLCVLDNLLKGGAGQALQALNLALELPEDLGLPRAGLGAA